MRGRSLLANVVDSLVGGVSRAAAWLMWHTRHRPGFHRVPGRVRRPMTRPGS